MNMTVSLPSFILLSTREDSMNMHDVRFGNIRKEGRKNIGSRRKYAALRLFVGRWVLWIGSHLTVDLGRVMDKVFLRMQEPQVRKVKGVTILVLSQKLFIIKCIISG